MRPKHKSLAISLLLLLLTLSLNSQTFAVQTTAADADDDDSYEETARVVRVSLLTGDVSLRRAGSDKWEAASLNLPLVEGDRLATGPGARLEIQIDARNFLRLGEYATLDIVTLRDEGIALSLPEGTATLRLAKFDAADEYFEIDAPATTLAAEQSGSYRLDVAENGNVRATVRDGGRARLYSETSGFTLRDGRAAELVANDNSSNAADADWDLSAARGFDDWDTWVDDRERYLATRLRHDGRDRYYDNAVWGAEELDAYGDWVDSGEYGYVWRPHVTVINIYHDWAPYRYGSWRWCPPYGWTWVGDEAWGWAPYHYGRWVSINNSWCWSPRGGYAHHGRRNSWWRPALVAFVNINVGGRRDRHIAWYPLGYRQRDPRSKFYSGKADGERGGQNRRGFDRINPAYQKAVTTLPEGEFSKGMVRAKAAPPDVAALAVSGDPLKDKLPARPVESAFNRGGASGGSSASPFRNGEAAALRGRKSSGGQVIRNPTDPTLSPAARKTGAALREPGLALDGELRRGRIYNNREPRPAKTERVIIAPTENAPNGTSNGERGTGAIARPIRRPDVRDGGDKNRGGNGVVENNVNSDGEATKGVPNVRRPPARPVEAGTDGERNTVTGTESGGERPERRAKSVERPERGRDDADGGTVRSPDYRRTRPETNVDGNSKPERRERQQTGDIYRPAPSREERQSRTERPEPRQEQPEAREVRPPRQEQPRQEQPRHERQESPRQERQESPRQQERPSSPPPREERRADPPREQPQQREMPRPPSHKERPDDND